MTSRGLSAWLVPYLPVALVFLVLYIGGLSLQSRKSGLPPGFDAGACDYPLRIEGLEVATPGQLRFVAEGWPAGDRLAYTDARGRQSAIVLSPAAGPWLLTVTAISGVFFWSVCLLVFVPRMHEHPVPLLFWILMLYGLAVMIGGVFFQRDPVSWGALGGLLQVGCLALLPPLFLRLTLDFPRRLSRHGQRSWLLPGVWIAAVVLIAWQAWAYWRYFSAPTPALARALTAPQQSADVFMLAVVALGFVNLIHQVRTTENARQTRQVRWLLWGFAVGTAPYLALRTLPELVGLPAPLPEGADRVLEMAVPLAFVCAVVREQFLDIDVVIRRSLLYSVLAAVVLGLILVPSLVLTWSFGELRPNVYRLVLLGGGLAAGILFNPLRLRISRAIDRWVFELRHDDQSLLDLLDRRLQTAVDPAAVDDLVVHTLGDWFGATVVLEPHDDDGWATGAPVIRAVEGATDTPELETTGFPAAWADRGYVVAVPVVLHGALRNWLLLGLRASRRSYLQAELKLAQQCARRAGVTRDRLQLIREIATEAEARHRLSELDRMKSEFLAQVAHDLRTPVAAVSWSTRNLLDGLAGDLNEAQAEYLASVADAAGHLDNMVSNLLEVSRLDDPTAPVRLSQFAVAPVIARAVSTVKPLARLAGVAITVRTDGAPPVVAHPERLQECLVNILDNAIKYSPPQASIAISAAADTDGRCRIEVADRGPGLQGAADPFARFAQGLASPYSSRKGFGLGLYVVHHHVEQMHGSISARNRAGGGARFTLVLPAAGPLTGKDDS